MIAITKSPTKDKIDKYILALIIVQYIEDITWLCGDTKFPFECWKIVHEWAQLTSEIFFQQEKRNFVSPSGHEIPNHFTLIVFGCERRNLLCSHSKGHIFTSEDIKFLRESSPGISPGISNTKTN